jgi:hypothetical protein
MENPSPARRKIAFLKNAKCPRGGVIYEIKFKVHVTSEAHCRMGLKPERCDADSKAFCTRLIDLTRIELMLKNSEQRRERALRNLSFLPKDQVEPLLKATSRLKRTQASGPPLAARLQFLLKLRQMATEKQIAANRRNARPARDRGRQQGKAGPRAKRLDIASLPRK